MVETTRLFELLASEPRRRILLLLCDADSIRVPQGIRTRGETRGQRHSPTGMDGDAERTGPVAVDGGVGEDSDALAVRLRHCELPKLEDEGLVEWDRKTWEVRRGPSFDDVKPALRLFAANAQAFPGDLL